MQSMKQIIIFGTGGNCIDILDSIFEINKLNKQFEILGFLDDNKEKDKLLINGFPVLGNLDKAKEYVNYDSIFFINGIGSSRTFYNRENIIERLNFDNSKYISIIHPKSFISMFASIGFGVNVFANVTIGSNVVIGNHVNILPNSIISHDSKIGDFSIITGGVCISGNVNIGKSCYIGTNSSIKEGVSVSDYCLIGMHSLVNKNTEKRSIYFGQPARFIKQLDIENRI